MSNVSICYLGFIQSLNANDINSSVVERLLTTKGRIIVELQDTEGQRLATEFMTDFAKRAVQRRCPVAADRSTTKRGGRVVTSSEVATAGGRVALAGDTVPYPDGSPTRIVTGSGTESLIFGKSLALIGSKLENGDRIDGPMHDDLVPVAYADTPIASLLQAGHLSSAN